MASRSDDGRSFTPSSPLPWRRTLRRSPQSARGCRRLQGLFSSCRLTLKVSLRPSTATSSLSQVTVMPTGVGAVCSSSSLVPTEPLPSPSASATLIQQVFSASATSAGVANTSSVPLPMVFAVLAAVTSTLCSPRIPVSNVIYFPLLFARRMAHFILNTFIRYHILHQNAPYFALFVNFSFSFCANGRQVLSLWERWHRR